MCWYKKTYQIMTILKANLRTKGRLLKYEGREENRVLGNEMKEIFVSSCELKGLGMIYL